MPFSPLRGMGSEARIQQIENFLAQLEGARGSSSAGLVGVPAVLPPAEQIPEDQVEFDSSTGHDHYNDGTYVPVYGDVSGTNAAVSVDKIKAVPVDAPVAGDDGQFLRFNNGAGTLSWETPVVGIVVQEGDSTVAAAATTVDFGAGFDVTESPSGEANIALDLSEAVTGDVTFTVNAGVVTKIRGFSVAAPVAGDDGEFLRYDHGTTSYSWQKPTITVQEGDVTVDAAVTVIDFGAGFDVTSSPAGEVNVGLDISEAATGDISWTGNNAVVIQLWALALANPVAGDDGQFLRYNHGTTSYSWEPPSFIVQEQDVSVDLAVTTLDFAAGFDVTSSPAGEANIALDLSEVVTGDVTFATNAATVGKIHNFAVTAPGAGDDGQFLRYNHGTTSYSWESLTTATIVVEESNVVVDSSISTLDFGSGFDVTAASGEADITLDLSEVVTGDLTMSTNVATVAKIQGKAIAAPGSTQHDAFVYFDNDASSFKYARPYTWVGTWFYNNVQAGQTADMFLPINASSADRSAVPLEWIAPLAGSIVTLQVYTNDVRTAGDCAVTVMINGVASSMIATLNASYTQHRVVDKTNGWDIGAITFAAGDRIGLQYTTVGYAPTTGDIIADILIVFD